MEAWWLLRMRAGQSRSGRQPAGHVDRCFLGTIPLRISFGSYPQALLCGGSALLKKQASNLGSGKEDMTQIIISSKQLGKVLRQTYGVMRQNSTEMVNWYGGVQVVPGKEDSCISCLAWVRDPLDGPEVLISGGLDGILTEWDLVTKVPRHTGDSFGGAVWDIAVQPDSSSEQGALPWLSTVCSRLSAYLTA